MNIKNYVGGGPSLGIRIEQPLTTFNIYTEIKQKRHELDSLLDSITQYTNNYTSLLERLDKKKNFLDDVNNQVELSYEQLEFVLIERKKQLIYNEQLSRDIQKQEEELNTLSQTIKERILVADALQQELTKFTNTKIIFEQIEEEILIKKSLIAELDAELSIKEVLVDKFEKSYTAKLNKPIKITKKTKFNQVG